MAVSIRAACGLALLALLTSCGKGLGEEAGAGADMKTDAVALWGRWERAFTVAGGTSEGAAGGPAGSGAAAGLEVELTAPDGRKRTVRAFRDGGERWRVRFMPDAEGVWKYRARVRPGAAEVEGSAGTFECRRGEGGTPFLMHGRLRVSADGTHFEHADGTPFFWLVDTAWNGALLSSPSDWERFLENRAAKGFTGVQFVMTQWRTAAADAEGRLAYTGSDEIAVNPAFFRRLDERIDAVNAKGLLAVPVLLWALGDREHTPGKLPERAAAELARYMVARYGAHHVAYFLGGDANYSGRNAERWKRIGRAVFGGEDHAPVFIHPCGMHWPYDEFLDEEWLSAFGYQSGHGDDARTVAWIHSGPPARPSGRAPAEPDVPARNWRKAPARPVVNLEPPYEAHLAYQSRKPHTAYTVRRAIYWSLLAAPTAGSSYGAHGVWSWETSPNVPRNHGGTGTARPWHEAMDLPGSVHMKHMADLFASIRWWELRPDPELVGSPEGAPVRPELTHVAYTRDRDGRAALYVQGAVQARATVAGDLGNWDEGYRLALANELTRDRSWLGELHLVAIHDRALGREEVARRYEAGPRRAPEKARALYIFAPEERDGDLVRDVSGSAEPLDLKLDDPGAVRWLPGGGLAARAPVLIASAGPARALARSIREAGGITVEAWVKPANAAQAGPARIVTLSRDTGSRNFTLGQDGGAYVARLRTTATSRNGIPALSTQGGSSRASGDAFRHVSASRSGKGDLAVIYLPVGGEVALRPGVLKEGLAAEWFDPRTAERMPARPERPDGPGRGKSGAAYRAPDERDWVLVLHGGPR